MTSDSPRRGPRCATLLTLLLLTSALTALMGCDLGRIFGDGPGNGELKVLFIGNSLTFWFDMPSHLEHLLESGKTSAHVADASLGSTTLGDHLEIDATRLAVGREDWDVVILEDGRYDILLPDVRTEITDDFRRWRDLIRQECPRARVVMYLDYAMDKEFEVAGETYSREEFAALLRQATLIVADSLGLEVAPVGAAWERVMVEHPEYNLYDWDGVHPSLVGQFLQASVYYATLVGESPAGLAYRAGLTREVARYLQRVAGETVLNERSTWNLPEAFR
jgi:hypothetical protein